MVEISQPSPGSFLSNSDKHRGTRLPLTIDDDLCLETGIDLGDGTHIVFRPGMRHSSYIYSISQHYPDECFRYHLLSRLEDGIRFFGSSKASNTPTVRSFAGTAHVFVSRR